MLATDAALALPVLDADKISEMQEVMEEEFQELMELFLHDTQDKLAQITTAYASGDAETLSRAAHGLKASSGNVGAVRLAELACYLDEQSQQDVATVSAELVAQLQLVAQQTETAVAALFN